MTDLNEARIEVVRRHMALEITHDWDGVIATFDHPRYELLGPGTVFDGEAAVRSYFAASREPFPDQANEVIATRVRTQVPARNPVHAALFLVLAFFTAAGIWLLSLLCSLTKTSCCSISPSCHEKTG